jgi:hypothetical protein
MLRMQEMAFPGFKFQLSVSENLCRNMVYMNGEIGKYYTTYLTFKAIGFVD